MPRIPLFDPNDMNAAQADVYHTIVKGPRGRLVGPLRAALHNPQLADRWQRFGEILRYETSVPQALVELAVLVTARRWSSQLEWFIHAVEARDSGLGEALIESIRLGETPSFALPEQADVYEFARQLQQRGDVDEDLYARVQQRLGVSGIVELTAVIGYYTLVSMTLNVHCVPLPDNAPPPLPSLARPGELFELPAVTPPGDADADAVTPAYVMEAGL